MITSLPARITGMPSSARSKEIVSPGDAVLTASRREPVTLSRAVTTGIFNAFAGVKQARNTNMVKDLSSFWVIMILVCLKK